MLKLLNIVTQGIKAERISADINNEVREGLQQKLMK
jgi:hypothetical protein